MRESRIVWCCLAVAVVVGLGLAACENATGTPKPEQPKTMEPAPGLAPEQAAAVLALSDQVEDVLESSLNAFMGPPTPQQEGLEALEVLAALDPEAVQPSVEGCAPMPEGADIDEDGYPAMKETLTINCSFALPPFMFELTGDLVLLDGDDTDPASGFESMLNYRLTMTDEDGTVTATGKRDLQVSKAADGNGYALAYAGRDVIDGLWDIKLTYTGTLKGTFASGMLAIDSGTFVLAPTPVAGQDQLAPGGASLTVQAARLDYDTANCETVLTGGQVNLTNDADAVIGISYEGCGARSVTYNGEPLPPA